MGLQLPGGGPAQADRELGRLSGDGDPYAGLRRNVSMLGSLLGEVVAEAEGEPFLALIEDIRQRSRAARDGDDGAREGLLALLHGLSPERMLAVARTFSQFLNLANIAEQQYASSRQMAAAGSATTMLRELVDDLANAGVPAAALGQRIDQLSIELVLTAHPTEIMRRTLIHKHREIGRCLSQLELGGLTEGERESIRRRLRELLTQVWFGDEFRAERPTPVDEARWGFAVVEDSLWHAVPEFLRRLDTARRSACGEGLALDAAPVRFLSWMGGDRDGNPNVTAAVTAEVLLLGRWQAADLYLRAVEELIEELSMTGADETLWARNPDANEPYRGELRRLRGRLRQVLGALEHRLDNGGEGEPGDGALLTEGELLEPLLACHRSLCATGMGIVAEGKLLDLLRRVRCFGVHLVRLDLRQDSARHTDLLSELTRYLGLGDYAEWDEDTRRAFLLTELASRRPLLPPGWDPGPEAAEVLATCRVAAAQPPEALGAYVISMARTASDVLAVHLILREAGCRHPLPVAPLFETLDDLDRAPAVVEALLDAPWFRGHCGGRLMVMIGYSDSAKDAGVLAASWAQYRAQEALLTLCQAHGIALTLFHGRGGTIGRGGAPAFDALLSQPPGSLENGLRVTEQGEIIRAKLGLAPLAVRTLALYTSAICRANLANPPTPAPAWRGVMDRLAEDSCSRFRAVVRDDLDFVSYFRHATPEQELASLPLGSRPARRAGGGGIETLRAIPWIFAWSQNRLMLPAWLGAGGALAAAVARGDGEVIAEMARDWPFFATRLSMLEMVFAKADSGISAYYDSRLVPGPLKPIGERLRAAMVADRDTVLALQGSSVPLEGQDWARQSIGLRNIYTDPLNYLQAELLERSRAGDGEDPLLRRAVMVTIAGIAAGMRNTG